MRGPCALKPAGHGVTANAARSVVHPAQALLLHIRTFRRGTEIGRAAVAMCFTHGVATSGQRDRFLIVHRHAGKGHAHILCGFERIRLAIHAFWVDVNQAHHDRRQRIFQIALAGVTAAFATTRREPLFLRTPIGVLFRMPNVGATEGETEGFQSHGFVSDIPRQKHQIRPTDFIAIFFLDRPEQTARFIQIRIVRP